MEAVVLSPNVCWALGTFVSGSLVYLHSFVSLFLCLCLLFSLSLSLCN